MPKIILPFQGAAAAGKNGKSENSIIYARTSAECDAQKMVTYTKSYKSPIQPNSALQLAARDKMRQLVLSLKAMSGLYVPGSLYGTYPVIENSFVSDRSRYIALCMRRGIHILPHFGTVDNSESLFKLQLQYDDLFNAYFSLGKLHCAVQIRGDRTNKYFYRDEFKFEMIDLNHDEEYFTRDIHLNTPTYFSFAVDPADFGGNTYTARVWISENAFPAPPENPSTDATSTWDIGNSVRVDFLYVKSA